MKLFLAHTLSPELLNLQEMPFVPGAHNKMDKFLNIVTFKKGMYCHHLVSELCDCSEVDIFQLEIKQETNDKL